MIREIRGAVFDQHCADAQRHRLGGDRGRRRLAWRAGRSAARTDRLLPRAQHRRHVQLAVGTDDHATIGLARHHALDAEAVRRLLIGKTRHP